MRWQEQRAANKMSSFDWTEETKVDYYDRTRAGPQDTMVNMETIVLLMGDF